MTGASVADPSEPTAPAEVDAAPEPATTVDVASEASTTEAATIEAATIEAPTTDGSIAPAVGSRDFYRSQMLAGIGGWSGALMAAIPTIIFVAVNAFAGLRPAVIAAVASALLLAGYRRLRGQSVMHALNGLVGVLIAAFIAYRTGEARGYFLFGIISSFGYAAAFIVTALVRRPLVGIIWEFLDPTKLPRPSDGSAPPPWYRVPRLLTAYSISTVMAAVILLARGIVQLALFQSDSTGWLAVARIAMGYPLTILDVVFAFWIVRRARLAVAADRPAGSQDAQTA